MSPALNDADGGTSESFLAEGSGPEKGHPEITPGQGGAVIGTTFLVVYVLTRTRELVGDTIVYSISVDRWLFKGAMDHEFFHPHHPLYNPLVALVTAGARLVSPGFLAMDGGALLSALLGALALGLTVRLLLARGYPTGIALLTGVVLGLSGGFWRFATRLEVYTLAAVAVVLWLTVMSGLSPGPRRAGAALAGAVTAHLALGVLAPATVLRVSRPWKRRLAALAIGLGLPAGVL